MGAETSDRVVASIGNTAITQSDVEREYRFELFLEGHLPAALPDAATFESVRDRLIDQKLLVQEAAQENIQLADPPGVAADGLAEVRKRFPSEEAFRSALRSLGMDEKQVLRRLTDRQRILRLIDQRLRPAAGVERAEIEAYYGETFVPEFQRRNTGPAPALADVESQIREILVQKKIDQQLEAWLQELKSSRRVKVHSF